MMSSDSERPKIALTEETKKRLKRQQRDEESFDETIERLLDIHGPAVAPQWAVTDGSGDEQSE